MTLRFRWDPQCLLDFLAGEFLHVAQRREVKRAATSARLPARIAQAARAVTAANVPDILQLEPLVAALPAAAGRDGRPRSKPGAVQGDRANWLAPATRDWRRKASWRWWPTPAVLMSTASASSAGFVERTLAWLHPFRRLALRYERRADVHEAFLTVCALHLAT